MVTEFDETRLDDPAVLSEADEKLQHLAKAGARIRIEAMQDHARVDLNGMPRGIIIVGAEARLIRAVLEPVCPVPFVAWPLSGLPGWVGPLDLVLVLASEPDGYTSAELVATVAEAGRRGAQVLLAAPDRTPIAQMAPSRAIRMCTRTADPTAAAVAVLSGLHEAGLGPLVVAENAAESAEMVAEQSSPYRDLSSNVAKDLACGLADADPLLWGGSVLAARASRRLAGAVRASSGRHALAGTAEEIMEVLAHAQPRDTFADPFTDGQQRRNVLVILDDERSGAAQRRSDRQLRDAAQAAGIRVCEIAAGQGSETDRYITLLMQGLYASAYLEIGYTQH